MLSQGRMTDGLNDHSIAVARVVLMVGHAKGGGGGGGGGSEYFESHAYRSVKKKKKKKRMFYRSLCYQQ